MRVRTDLVPPMASPLLDTQGPPSVESAAFAPEAALFPQCTPLAPRTPNGTIAFRADSGELPPSSAYGPMFNAVLDNATTTAQEPGNRVDLLADGVVSFAERERLIRGAKQSVFLQTFIFHDDETSWATAKLLAEKAKEGVRVCVIYDGILSRKSGDAIFDFMRANGVAVREHADPWKQPWEVNNRWHEKLLLVDGAVAITGGMNIANEYAFGGTDKRVTPAAGREQAAWRDLDVRVSGPAVRDLVRRFSINWERLGAPLSEAFERETVARAPAPLPQGGVKVRVISQEKGSDDLPIMMAYALAIHAAKRRIVIENPYFFPTREIQRALLEALARGVEVCIMTNSRATGDISFLQDISRFYYDELVAAGAKIYEREDHMIHAKSASFDDEFSIIGTANLNRRSAGCDAETVVCIDDTRTAEALSERFASGLAGCKQVLGAELAAEDWLTNAKQWAVTRVEAFC